MLTCSTNHIEQPCDVSVCRRVPHHNAGDGNAEEDKDASAFYSAEDEGAEEDKDECENDSAEDEEEEENAECDEVTLRVPCVRIVHETKFVHWKKFALSMKKQFDNLGLTRTPTEFADALDKAMQSPYEDVCKQAAERMTGACGKRPPEM